MFKKILASILCACTLAASLSSCKLPEFPEESESEVVSTPQSSQPSDEKLRFDSYENILDSLHFMTVMYNYYKMSEADREDHKDKYDLSTEESRLMYERLDSLVSDYYPPALGSSSKCENAFAYGIKDLNGDGSDELVLIEGDRLGAIAVFTEKDGQIVIDNSLSPASPSGRRSDRLSYWINTLRLDLKPLFAKSKTFDLGIIRDQTVYELERSLRGAPFSDVYVSSESRIVPLMDYEVNTPSGKKPLSKIEDKKFAYVDLNGDTVKELVIDCGELLVLDWSSASVNLHRLSIGETSVLNTDGTFSWEISGDDREYGESRIVSGNSFENCGTEVLWRAVNDGEPDAEYYIGSISVTRDELQKYLAKNRKTPVELLPLDELWGATLSPLDAIEVGREYWEDRLSAEELDVDVRFRSMYFDEKLIPAPESVYIINLIKYDSHHNSTYIEEIWINKHTGEITPPYEVNE